MTVIRHYNRGNVKRRAQHTIERVKVQKSTTTALLMLHYSLFLKDLLKGARQEAKNAKITKAHIKSVATKILRKYKR